MSNRPTQNCNPKNQARGCSGNLEYLIAPKYLEPIDAIRSQRLISALRPPSEFIVSKGFIVSSCDEAISAIERFASFEKELPNEPRLRPWLIYLQQPPRSSIRIEFPETLLYSRPLLDHYRNCTVSPLGNSHYAVQFGDGVMAHGIHAYMKLPSLVVAEQRSFFLEPIPNTRGAKAFSLDCAIILLADQLSSHPQIAIKSTRQNLEITCDNAEFLASFENFSYHQGIAHHHDDLLIFPCPGTEIPWHFRERVVVTVAPSHTPPYETTEQLTSSLDRLSRTTSIITSGLQELFGLHSRTRVRSVSLDTNMRSGPSHAATLDAEPKGSAE